MSQSTTKAEDVTEHDVVFLIDVDNTLLDNDRVTLDLRSHLEREAGEEHCARYWEIFEQLRNEVGYADYLGALQRYRQFDLDDTRILHLSFFLLDYPFHDRLYPHALELLRALRKLGPTVIFSDGDVVFQPHKVRRAGLWDAVDGQVLIYIHKEQMLDAVLKRFPARYYVMIDDKLRILSAMKAQWHERLTTVFVRQGHYAIDPEIIRQFPPADVSVERIGDVNADHLSALIGAAGRNAARRVQP